MWCASPLMPYPRSRPRRWRTRAGHFQSSMISMPAPSPQPRSHRGWASQGRDAFQAHRCGERAHACSESSHAMGVDGGLAPPQIIASASPRWMILKEFADGVGAEVQAVAVAEWTLSASTDRKYPTPGLLYAE